MANKTKKISEKKTEPTATPTPQKKVLIIGIKGGLAQILAKLLSQHRPDLSWLGIDNRENIPTTGLANGECLTFKYSRGNFEKLFRENNFDYVFHLGRVTHTSSFQQGLAQRLDLNIMGTGRILDLCLKHAVKKIVILSTFHVYGALSDNPIYLTEDSSLRASIRYPDLRDVVEMDQLATSWMWKYQNQIQTVVLRPCNIIGPQISNAISRYLISPFTPTPIDYRPMFQFLHEFDMATVLLRSIDELPIGVYNVAPPEIIPLQEARKIVGVPGLPAPIFVLGMLARLIKKQLPHIPDYLADYLKFSCLIDSSAIKKHLGEDFTRFPAHEALELLKI